MCGHYVLITVFVLPARVVPAIKLTIRLFLRSDAREVSGNYSPVGVPSGTEPPEGEASGPPANAETYTLTLTVQLFIRVAASPEPPPAKGCNTRKARSCPRWLQALTCKLKVQLNIPGLSRLFIYRVKAAGPGMCDFPFRRKSGTGNRIPGDFFVSFFGRAKKEMPRRHEASGKAGAPAARADKERTNVRRRQTKYN